MGHRPSAALGSLLAVLAAAVLAPAPAAADHGNLDVPWPQLLPPLQTTTEVQPGPVPRCPRARLRCVRQLERHLRREWRRLDRSCDHRAVIYYSYLRITRGLRRDLGLPRGHPSRLVGDRRWMSYLITDFSNLYRAAFDDYAEGRPVPDAWRITFEAADRGDYNAGQDVLLFSNAHVQHDLPFALERMGLAAPSGRSRKPDHDAVNLINSRVFDPIQDFVAARYDPSFATLDASPSPLDELGVLELVKLWREGAWRNAERLLAAGTPAERAHVVRSIEDTSRLWAQLITAVQIPGTREARDSHCAAARR